MKTTAKNAAYAYEAAPVEAQTYDAGTYAPQDFSCGHVTIRKVVRETRALSRSTNGHSIGTQVDEMLLEAAHAGDEVQSFEMEIAPDFWREFAGVVRKGKY